MYVIHFQSFIENGACEFLRFMISWNWREPDRLNRRGTSVYLSIYGPLIRLVKHGPRILHYRIEAKSNSLVQQF